MRLAIFAFVGICSCALVSIGLGIMYIDYETDVCIRATPVVVIVPNSTLVASHAEFQSERYNLTTLEYVIDAPIQQVRQFYGEHALCDYGQSHAICSAGIPVGNTEAVYYAIINNTPSIPSSYTVEISWKCRW